jgi:hypothetical protein
MLPLTANETGCYELRLDLCCDELAKLLDFWRPSLAFGEVGEGREAGGAGEVFE